MKLFFRLLSIVPILLIISFTSCDYEYKGYVSDFEGGWSKERVLTFHPSIEDTSLAYRIKLDLRHVYGYGDKFLKLRSRIETPSGELRVAEHDVLVRKKGGVKEPEYLGNCSGDICDRRSVLYEAIRFSEKGEYRIDIEHRMNFKKLAGVLELGLLLEIRDDRSAF